MGPILDDVFRYRGFCGNAAECRLRVYQRQGKAVIVVASETYTNRGSSVVSMASRLARWVWQMLERPADGMIWIEHIPQLCSSEDREGFSDVDTFSRVFFPKSPENGTEIFADPVWTVLSLEELNLLVRQD